LNPPVGGQDNIQAVAGQMLGFFAELGFIFPQFPYIAHSRGWSREDMERNVEVVRNSAELAEGAGMLAKRCLALAAHLIAQNEAPASIELGCRGLVARRSATDGRGNVNVPKLKPVLARAAFRLRGEPRFVQGAIEEVAGTIARKHAACAIGPVRSRGDADD
jgi:hypothetical protein